jgi:hypothetical protein
LAWNFRQVPSFFSRHDFRQAKSQGWSPHGRRRGKRQLTDIAAEILFPGLKPLPCRITDLSTEGARLELTSTFGLPLEFELRVGRQIYRVRLVRRGPRSVAIKFRG